DGIRDPLVTGVQTCALPISVPRLALRDPFAVRALVAVLVVATFFAAGGERMKRIAAAFDWQGVIQPANFRIDAWVSPPPYTGRRSEERRVGKDASDKTSSAD